LEKQPTPPLSVYTQLAIMAVPGPLLRVYTSKALSEELNTDLPTPTALAPEGSFTSTNSKRLSAKLKASIKLVASAKSAGDKIAATKRCVDYVRVLSAEMVQKAGIGHPGAPMGCAPMAHFLYGMEMNFDPTQPYWINRDRFVLSNGHASALIYTMLHLTGFDLSMEDIKQFRQMGSITPGHPERQETPGVEVTTGPLGQGVSNAVGLAIAQAHLGATFNRDGFQMIDNYTYCILGDGCLQEGVSAEACSLAGHLKLGNLICLWDDNKIQIDGSTDIAFTEDVLMRYQSYGWQTLTVGQGDSANANLLAAIQAAKKDPRPTLIQVATTIGYGSKKAGSHAVHGNPLGKEDLAGVKALFGFDPNVEFTVPPDVLKFYRTAGERGSAKRVAWDAMFADYAEQYPELAAEFTRRVKGELPAGWKEKLPRWKPTDKKLATRKSSEAVITTLYDMLPEMIGGSADLTGSNLTRSKNAVDFQADIAGGTYLGRYLRYGVREHGMAAISNGLAAYGMLKPFCATFLNFIAYGQGSVRVSALSQLGVIYIGTHDSIGLGEDGPTHQPVEAMLNLRATPNLLSFRPADANEVTGSYIVAMENPRTPSVLALSRQDCANLEGTSPEGVAYGAYVLSKPEGALQVVLVGTGSEVAVLAEAAKALAAEGVAVQLVSMPCWELFDNQPMSYRLSVFPSGVPVLSMEAMSAEGWSKYAHYAIGMRSFGMSAPAPPIFQKLGITADNAATQAKALIAFYKTRPCPSLIDRPDAFLGAPSGSGPHDAAGGEFGATYAMHTEEEVMPPPAKKMRKSASASA